MGMDIYAIAPKDPSNNYWRSAIGGWSVLGGYVYEIAADTINTVGAGEEYWFTNDGVPWSAECCERIAAEVRAHIADHGIPEMHDTKPNPTSAIHEAVLETLVGNGGAHVYNMQPTNYLAESVIPFCEFLEQSGGIEIW